MLPNPPSPLHGCFPISPMACFSMVIMAIYLSMADGDQTVAFNCEKASVRHDPIMTKHLRARGGNLWLSHHIKSNDVFFSHGSTGNLSTNHVFVRHEEQIYAVECPRETVTLLPAPSCYANGIREVMKSDGTNAFINQNHFIQNVATPVPCQNLPLDTTIKQKIDDFFIFEQGSEQVALAALKNNQLFDLTLLLNNDSLQRLILFEEKAMNNDNSAGSNASITTMIMVEYRRHSVKIQFGILAFRIALDVILFIAGLINGLPIIKSVALASGSVKKIIDFRNYLLQDKLSKQDKILKLHRRQLGRNPDADLGQLTSVHLQCIYEALLKLTERCADVEDILNDLLCLDESGAASPAASRAAARRRRSSSSSSVNSSTSGRRSRLPAFKKVTFGKNGVAFRTK